MSSQKPFLSPERAEELMNGAQATDEELTATLKIVMQGCIVAQPLIKFLVQSLRIRGKEHLVPRAFYELGDAYEEAMNLPPAVNIIEEAVKKAAEDVAQNETVEMKEKH